VTAAVASRTSRSVELVWSWPVVVAGCAVLAIVSLAVPATLGYDPWAWLVWGREVGRASLDTTGGPSWKPLPVAGTTLLAPLGGLVVPAYTVLARTAALLGVVAVARLAARLGGPVAAVFAAVALALTPDGDPRFVRLLLEGHEAPWSMGLAAAALLALHDRRPRQALAWTWLLALLRPEAWPFLAALVAWQAGWRPSVGRGERARRSARPSRWATPARRSSAARWGVTALVSVPVLWFVPDRIGSGSAVHGAAHAQVLAEEPVGSRLADGAATALGMVPLPVWALAAVAVVAAWRRRDPMPAAVAAAALAWTALVVGMAALLGYAAISRFFLPAAAVACALAGAGLVPATTWARRRGAATAVVLAVLAALLVAPRVLGVGDVLGEVADRGRLEEDLDATVEAAGGTAALARCGSAVVTARTLLRSAAAWKLDLPLHRVERAVPGRRAVLLLQSEAASARARRQPETVALAQGQRWSAFADRCPELTG